MRSRIAQHPAAPCTPEVPRAAAGSDGEPDVVLDSLAPGGEATATLEQGH